MALLALPAPGSEEDKVSEVRCGLCFLQKRVEPAGRSFHAAHEKPLLEGKRKGRGRPATDDKGNASDNEQDAPGDAAWRKKRKEGGQKSGGALKLSPALQGEDLYALLEVSESASAEQIKKQYRKLALQHHPDKQDNSNGASKDQKGLSDKDMLFVKIQEAYEVLADPTKRQQYDSTLDFDDSIAEEVNEKLGFFGTFTPIFRRNARWSVRTPVPELGEESTDMSKVRRFYDFWFAFESWRDFSAHDEFNLDDAEFREERRWMERQNQKIRKKYYEAERRRILRLVEAAERLDPRIKAEKDEKEAKKRQEKEKRAKQKQDEEDEKRRKEEEKRLQEERAKAEKEEKELAEKEMRKQKQQESKALRQRLKKAAGTNRLDEVQEMGLSLDIEPLAALCERLEAAKAGAARKTLLDKELEDFRKRKVSEVEEQARQREEARKKEEQKANEAKEQNAGSGPLWCTEELGILAKGLQKFPGGVGGRWALIAQFLQTNGFNRNEKEVVEKTKELSEGQSLRSMGSRLDWQNPKAKAKAVAAEKPAESADAKKAAGAGTAAPTADAAPNDPAADWSTEQQKAFEAALQRHPASLDKNERWKLIAEDVPGKTKAQCVARFKYLREQLQKK